MAYPILFTLPPSNRHEFLTLSTTQKPSLKTLNQQISSALASSPNCAEFMGKYKTAAEGDKREVIQELRVHWSGQVHDLKIWPEYTVVTEENLGAVLELLKGDVRSGVLEVKVGKGE